MVDVTVAFALKWIDSRFLIFGLGLFELVFVFCFTVFSCFESLKKQVIELLNFLKGFVMLL